MFAPVVYCAHDGTGCPSGVVRCPTCGRRVRLAVRTWQWMIDIGSALLGAGVVAVRGRRGEGWVLAAAMGVGTALCVGAALRRMLARSVRHLRLDRAPRRERMILSALLVEAALLGAAWDTRSDYMGNFIADVIVVLVVTPAIFAPVFAMVLRSPPDTGPGPVALLPHCPACNGSTARRARFCTGCGAALQRPAQA